MKYTNTIAATVAGLSTLTLGLPLVASASIFDQMYSGSTYSVGYGPGTSMCPSPYDNYYSCPSGIGGLFGAQTGYGGGYGSYGTGYGGSGDGYAPSYQQSYHPSYQYYPPPTYYPQQQQQYAYYPQQQYYQQPSYNYSYGYYPQTIYGPVIYY